MSIQHYVAANANPVRPDEATHYRHLVTYADHVAALESEEMRLHRHYEQVVKDAVAEAEQRGMTNSHRGRTMYAAGVSDAREAVAACPRAGNSVYRGGLIEADTALAAIDVLRSDHYSDSHQPQIDGTEAHDECERVGEGEV